MEQFLQPQILVSIAIGAVGIVTWYYIKGRRDSKKQKSKQGGKGEKAPAQGGQEGTTSVSIYDDETRTQYTKELTAKERKEVGDLGQEWNEDGARLYELHRFKDKDGKYKLEPVPPAILYDYASPTELFNDLNCETETAMVIRLKPKQNILEKYGKYIPWAVAVMFIMFLFISEINN